jgi:hypothetical protein
MEQGIGSVQMFSTPRQLRAVKPGYMMETAARASGTLVPRLLDLDAAAAYLSMSPWTVRDLEAKGVLPRVRVPLPQGGELRKLLFDKADLDRLIGAWKDTVG